MADTTYKNGDSEYDLLRKILLKLQSEFTVDDKNKYKDGDKRYVILKKVLRIFNDGATFGGGGGGGDSQRFFAGAGDPNGTVTATVVPALYADTTNDTFWIKTAGAGTATGWAGL